MLPLLGTLEVGTRPKLYDAASYPSSRKTSSISDICCHEDASWQNAVYETVLVQRPVAKLARRGQRQVELRLELTLDDQDLYNLLLGSEDWV